MVGQKGTLASGHRRTRTRSKCVPCWQKRGAARGLLVTYHTSGIVTHAISCSATLFAMALVVELLVLELVQLIMTQRVKQQVEEGSKVNGGVAGTGVITIST